MSKPKMNSIRTAKIVKVISPKHRFYFDTKSSGWPGRFLTQLEAKKAAKSRFLENEIF